MDGFGGGNPLAEKPRNFLRWYGIISCGNVELVRTEMVMKTLFDNIKPVLALATSAMLGAGVVLGAVAMLGNAKTTGPELTAPRAVQGLGRFNTTDIRVVQCADER